MDTPAANAHLTWSASTDVDLSHYEIRTTHAPDLFAAPKFNLRSAAGGKLEVVWTKGVYDGVRLQFDLGPDGMQADIDLRPSYTLDWLLAPSTTAIVKVRLMYIHKGKDTGNWSVWKPWTLTGV